MPNKYHLQTTDPEIAEFLEKELKRQEQGLEMIPSENYVSRAVLEALGSILTNKYSEGYPSKRYYGGNQFIDQIENLAIARAQKLFGAEHVNVQPYSGSPANLAVYMALLKVGDKIMGMDLACGGHLTHGYKVSASGKFFTSVSYYVNENGLLDYDAILKVAKKEKPRLIIAGASAYPRLIDFASFAEIAKETGAYFMADIAHIAGLIIGEVHPSPVPYADVVTTTTHKTLRGPRGAIIMSKIEDSLDPGGKKNLAQKIDSAVFPGLQGGPHNHQTAAIAVALKEAGTSEFKNYAKQIIKNAKALAETLLEEGLELVTGGTDNHLMLIDLTNLGIGGKQAETALDQAGITVNKNVIPFDQRKPMDPSGIRLGTPALTARGMKEKEMKIIGHLISQVLKNINNEDVIRQTKKAVEELTAQFPIYKNK